MSADPGDAIEPSEGVAGLPISRAELNLLSTPRPGYVLAKTALLLGGWLALALAARALDPWWQRLPIWIVLGLVVNGLVQLGHDAWHQNLFRTPWQNELYGHVFGVLFGVSYTAARHAHLRHHWYNRTERDPDAYNVGSGVLPWVQFYLVVFLGLPLAPLHFDLLYPILSFKRADWPRHLAIVAVYAAIYSTVAIVARAHGFGGLVIDLWIVPILCASPWNGLKSIADHYANTWRGDRFHTATTVRTHPILAFLWHGLNHHLDHHLFPRVPGHNLARLHARLRPELERRGAPVFDGYLRVFWRAFRAGPTYVEGEAPFLRGRA